MSRGYVFTEKEGSIATLYFNRTEKRNALSLEMWTAIPELLKELELDDEIKVLVIRGVDETAFAAGADISEFKTLRSTAEGARQYNDKVLEAEAILYHFSKPTIAMIQKYCVGGGCELAMACDLRFSSENGIFGITPAKLGLIYNLAGTKNLVDIVGPARAKDILFSGRLLDAKEAYEFGLIDRVYNDEEVVQNTYEYAQLISERAQKAVKGSKKIIKEILNGATEESTEIAQMILSSFESEDYKEGVKAFLDKRKPNFIEV
jgi:enoyl-CoA hydratase